jgi:hypothetical protein
VLIGTKQQNRSFRLSRFIWCGRPVGLQLAGFFSLDEAGERTVMKEELFTASGPANIG